MRAVIDIPSDRLQSLARWALSCKISRAEAVRRAVGDLDAGQTCGVSATAKARRFTYAAGHARGVA